MSCNKCDDNGVFRDEHGFTVSCDQCQGQWLYVREVGNDYPQKVLERNSKTGKTRIV